MTSYAAPRLIVYTQVVSDGEDAGIWHAFGNRSSKQRSATVLVFMEALIEFDSGD
jgi:hypothetical protein